VVGSIFRKTPDTALYSIYVSTFVVWPLEIAWERVRAQRNQSALRSPGVEEGSDRKRADFHTV
jgi:hypothetical protein